MESLGLDLRYAVRALRNRPGFTLLAVLTLAVGIGVNTVAFNAASSLLMKSRDFRGAEQLGWIMMQAPGNPHGLTTLPDYQDLTRATRAFDAVIAEGRLPLSLRTGQGARQAWSLVVSADYLTVLDARPEIGRLFSRADLQSSEIPAVLSHRFWLELGGGSSIAGRSIVLNGRTVAVIGVLTDDFQGPGGLYAPDVWVPLERIGALNLPAGLSSRTDGWLTLIGRRIATVSPAQADADLRSVFASLALAHPDTNAKRGAAFFPMMLGHPEARGIAPFIWMTMAIVGIVLLIACFNVAGLLFARAAERQREVAIRAALGASRARILRQLITESTVLAVLSGAAALMVAAWSAGLLSAFSLPSPIPQRLHLGLNPRLIGFTALLVAVCGVLPALLPALQATRRSLLRTMTAESAGAGRRSRLRNAFVVAQIAGSTLFLAAAMLFVRSFLNTAAFDPGFDTAHTLVLEINPSAYGYDIPRSRAFFENLGSRIRTTAGVTSAAYGDRIPFYVGFPKTAEVSTDGTNCTVADCRRVGIYGIGIGYFDALGVALTAGRDLTMNDMRTRGAVVISQKMAAQFWPGGSPIGRSIRVGSDPRELEVVGVAADTRHRSLGETPGPYLYRPLLDSELADPVTVIVRAAGEPRPLLAAVQEQLRALDPDLPPASVKTMTERLEMPQWPARTAAVFFAICGTLALVLATIGLFGVTYYAVLQRTREFGVRLALGATSRDLATLVLREGLQLTLPGVAVGVIAALIGARLLSATLFGISPSDPVSFAATALAEAVVALAACAVPAWRATRADPMIALRQE